MQRPNRDQLNKFLDLRPGSGRPSTRPAPGAGGAAGEFLRQRLQGRRPSPGEGIQRPGRPERPQRPNRPEYPPRLRPVDQIKVRQEIRNQVRQHFQLHHPHWNFWQHHPHWAHWGWHHPYRWAAWSGLVGWFPWGWNSPVYYDYGNNVYYEGDTVYYGDQPVASAEEYAQQAQQLATSAPEPKENGQWLPLGVFAITPDEKTSGAAPTLFLQLAVDKQGLVAGTFYNQATDQAREVEGLVDKQSQRTAWTLKGEKWPVMETGIANLTKDEVPVLVHFEDGTTQQWLLIRLEEPKEAAAGASKTP